MEFNWYVSFCISHLFNPVAIEVLAQSESPYHPLKLCIPEVCWGKYRHIVYRKLSPGLVGGSLFASLPAYKGCLMPVAADLN